MPATALQHFNDDLRRARAIVAHADLLPSATFQERELRSDLLRSCWMFAVGALDAYFCDAYSDIVAAAIICKSRQPAIVLPEFFYDIRLPIRAILEPYASNPNWRWRMATRKMMEREAVLGLEAIQNLFNKFFRDGHRFFGDVLERWIVDPNANKRLFGTTRSAYLALGPIDQGNARRTARQTLRKRFGGIFQRRHDCIHNCDRPRVAPQPLARADTVEKVIEDVQFLVQHCDGHINLEFREFLVSCGSRDSAIAQVGY